MRIMAILFGASAFVYYVTGLRGGFSRKKRFYFALGTYIVLYLTTLLLVLLGENNP
jgi:uncharacterized membrane protein